MGVPKMSIMPFLFSESTKIDWDGRLRRLASLLAGRRELGQGWEENERRNNRIVNTVI